MPDEAVVRAKAREAVRTARLPSWRPDRTWGGPGIGVRCTICGEPVTKEQLEFQVEFAEDGADPRLDRFHIHVRCFAAWEFERDRDGRPHS
jgi:hypothetical protein